MRNKILRSLEWKMGLTTGLLLLFLIAIAGVSVSQMQGLRDRMIGMGEEQLGDALIMADLAHHTAEMRALIITHVITANPIAKNALDTKISELEAETDELMQAYVAKSADCPPDELALVTGLSTAWEDYKTTYQTKALVTSRAGHEDQARAYTLNEATASYENVHDAIDNLTAFQQAAAATLLTETEQVYRVMVGIQLGLALVALILGFVLSFGMSRSIGGSVRKLTAVALTLVEEDLPGLLRVVQASAAGDLTRTAEVRAEPVAVKSQDELGTLAEVFNGMISQFGTLAAACGTMNASLGELAQGLRQQSAALQTQAARLATGSQEAARATAQITVTVEQVAVGTGQQAASMGLTAQSVEQMARAIDGVAHGAQEQAAAVTRAADLTTAITAAVAQVSAGAQQSAQGAAAAAQAARQGAETVGRTLAGMDMIQRTVNDSERKVGEMGERSGQIGAIVETINDIAGQTNLLALNAAIEAARAGEHGRGFAVVADEVRKLAEKSAMATKEIGALVAAIQTSVHEAEMAMASGSTAVAAGVSESRQAEAALKAILQTVEHVNGEMGAIAQAAGGMQTASEQLVQAMEGVSAVVEENTASTEEMAAQSSEVRAAIENIASIAEENSAAVEEVAAAANEVNGQVEEVEAAARALAGSSAALAELAGRFQTGRGEGVAPQVARPAAAAPRLVPVLN
jgi:methyl-accepting chemotaxis protein